MPVFELQAADGRKFQVDAPTMEAAAQSLDDHVASSPAKAPLKKSVLDAAIEPITSIPAAYQDLIDQATKLFGSGVADLRQGNLLKGAGKAGLGALEYLTAPINAPMHTIVGKPVGDAAAAMTGSERSGTIAGNAAELAAGLVLPIPKGIPRGLRAAPQAPAARMLDVTLSEGQASRDLPLIQREQAAARGTSGPPAEKVAKAFLDQQKGELEAARDRIARGFDPFQAEIAESPQQMGDVVSQSVRRTAATAKADVDAAYREARSLPGQIHAGAFEGMAQQIKGDLSLRDEPVIIDGKLTPFAARMIDDLEQRVSRLKIENRADPFGQPNPERIVGIDLKGVDQMRKRLSAMRRDASGSGNAADGRAAKAVIDAFDERIDAAVNGGLFTGDQRAVNAWNTARAAYADYRSTFTAGKNDPLGRVVEKIIGNRTNDPAIANDVADYMVGASGTNPSSLNVGVTKRIKSILGDRSAEWSGVKQGIFRRLDNPESPPKTAKAIRKFVESDGKEMAGLVYSDSERSLLLKYANLMDHLTVPQAGANWSNTATFAGQGYKPSAAARALTAIGSNVGMVVGGMLGTASHLAIGGLPFGAAEAAGVAASKIAGLSGQAMEARAVAKQMPTVAKAAKSFTASATAAEASPTSRNVARLMLAIRNLANNLKNIGVSMSPDDIMRAMQGSQSTPAENQTPTQVPRITIPLSPENASTGNK